MKKKILVDMDGVLANVYLPLIEGQYTNKGMIKVIDDLNGIEEYKAFPDLKKIVSSNNFFYHAPLMEDAIEGLKYLNDKYDLLIVSAATEFPGCINDKQMWLQKYFPFISYKQMIFCGKKDSVMGDIMIDDHPKNLDYFKGHRILFTQPHNINLKNESYSRFVNWKEVMQIL